jgi:hypothetical protein
VFKKKIIPNVVFRNKYLIILILQLKMDMWTIYALRNTWDSNIVSSYRNKILIDTEVIWMMIEISTLFCQPHRSNSIVVLQTVNNRHCQNFYKQ